MNDETPVRTAKVLDFVDDVVAAYRRLRIADERPENIRHLWSLALSIVMQSRSEPDPRPSELPF